MRKKQKKEQQVAHGILATVATVTSIPMMVSAAERVTKLAGPDMYGAATCGVIALFAIAVAVVFIALAIAVGGE